MTKFGETLSSATTFTKVHETDEVCRDKTFGLDTKRMLAELISDTMFYHSGSNQDEHSSTFWTANSSHY